MRRALLGWFLLSSVAHAAPRVSPRARMVAAGGLEARTLGSAADPRAQLLVEVTGGAAVLTAAGFDARPLTRSVAAVRASADELRRLIALPGVRTVDEQRVLQPRLDKSAPLINVPAARVDSGVDGTGALIAVVDTGVDFRHPDLRGANGKTRIEALVDVSQPLEGLVDAFRVPPPGRIFLRADIDAQLAADAVMQTPALVVNEVDTNGHGTHVAGIAASNGLATDLGFPAGRYVGMAPGAELLAVQASRDNSGSFQDADVLGAAAWAVDEAARLGKPVVLNLSLGGPGGPHDGTTSLEKGLDEIFPPDVAGQALVVAAGNDGLVDLHAGKSMLDGELVIPLELGKYTDANGQVMIEIWYSGGTLELAAETPGGFVSPGVGPGATSSTEPIVTNHINEGKIVINQDAEAREDGRRSAGIALVGATDASPTSGTWKLHVRGQATRFDAWVVASPSSGAAARFTTWVDTDERIGLPGTAHNAIVVGSFGSRNEWVTVDGMDIMRPNVIGDASPFSSSGPSADGRFVPDVLAPGEFIISALSRDAPPDMPSTAFYVPNRPTFGWADDGLHGVLRGTSQASPHVTGVIALMYQVNPTLTPNQIREILRATAHPQAPGYTPREGFGHVDALAALRYLRGLRGAGVDATTSSVGLLRDLLPPGDATTTVTVTPRDVNGMPVGPGHDVGIEASAGVATGPVVDVGFGRYERTFAAQAPRGTAARVTVVADGVELVTHPTFYIAADRSEIGNNFVARGGCAVSGRPEISLGTALLIAAALWLSRNSRRRQGRSTLEP